MVLPRRPAALSLLRSVCQLCSRSGAHLLARERLFPWRCPQQWPDSGNGRVSTGKFYLCGNKLLTVEKAYQSNYPWVEISRPRWGNADKSTRTAQSWGECLFVFRSDFEDGAILQRSLWLKNITSEDLSSTFTCVVKNAAGKVQKLTTFTRTSELCGKNS